MIDHADPRWPRFKELFSEAIDLPAASREAWIEHACAGDAALRRDLEALVSAHDRAGTFLHVPVLAIPQAARVVVEATESALGGTSPPARFGAYRVVRELGRGGMGVVYLGARDDDRFDQLVAIKVVSGDFFNPAASQRFHDERRILASLDHPHIARLLDAGTSDDGVPYVVMEYVEGEAIDEYCSARRLPIRERLVLFGLVCGAAQYSHQHLVVHRDLKVRNILVTADGVPKLLDFGIAKLLEPGGVGSHVTRTGFRALTPESASPEQVRGEPVTVSTDVYSLGVLLYRLLTGRSPYRGAMNTELNIVRAICEEEPLRPSQAVALRDAEPAPPPAGSSLPQVRELRGDLDLIVLKALHKDPARRYASVEQLAQDIQWYLDRRPILAAPDAWMYRARKFAVRHRAGLFAAVALALAVAGGVGSTIRQSRVAGRERARAERQFNAVRTLASSVLGELNDAVAKLPGSTPARVLLTRRATEYLDALVPEAAGNAELQRELAGGYFRLAEVQGTHGMANVGDSKAALDSYRKAASLLESLAAALPGSPRDRVSLASTYARIGAFESDRAARTAHQRRAVALLDTLPENIRAGPEALSVAVLVWFYIADEQMKAKDYRGAKISNENQARAAEAVLKLTPESLNASRNLSVVYRSLGGTLEMLDAADEALGYYQRALALDRTRLERAPQEAESRLDLSFSYGAIGAVLFGKGNGHGAHEYYSQAIELRRAAVAADPSNDFARTSLARGHDRMAQVLAGLGDLTGAVQAEVRRVNVLRDRVTANPERVQVWQDQANATFSAILTCLNALESINGSKAARVAAVSTVQTLIAELADLHGRWAHEQLKGVLPPAKDDLARAVQRLGALAHR